MIQYVSGIVFRVVQRALCTEFGPEDVSLLERCPHFRGCYVQASMVSSFQRVLCTGFHGVGT